MKVSVRVGVTGGAKEAEKRMMARKSGRRKGKTTKRCRTARAGIRGRGSSRPLKWRGWPGEGEQRHRQRE
jgi:hypothetical protein